MFKTNIVNMLIEHVWPLYEVGFAFILKVVFTCIKCIKIRYMLKLHSIFGNTVRSWELNEKRPCSGLGDPMFESCCSCLSHHIYWLTILDVPSDSWPPSIHYYENYLSDIETGITSSDEWRKFWYVARLGLLGQTLDVCHCTGVPHYLQTQSQGTL